MSAAIRKNKYCRCNSEVDPTSTTLILFLTIALVLIFTTLTIIIFFDIIYTTIADGIKLMISQLTGIAAYKISTQVALNFTVIIIK